MKRILTILTIIFLSICVSGCSPPVGNFGNGSGSGTLELDFMWLVPSRLIYETEQSFDKYQDLQILVAEDGVVKEVPVTHEDVKVEVLYFDSQLDDPVPAPVTNRFFEFAFPGRHAVKVTYKEKSAQYSVEVRGTATGEGDGSDFFDTVWL